MVFVYRVGFLCLSFMYWHMYIFSCRWRCRKLRDSSSRARRRCSLLQIASWGAQKSFLCVRIVSVCPENSFCVYVNVHVYIWVFIYLYVSVSRNYYLGGKVSCRVNGVCSVVGYGFMLYKMANMHRMPYLYRSFPAKEPYNSWLFRGKIPAT